MSETNSITQEHLHELFEYRDGDLYWKKSSAACIKTGEKAGSIKPKGYVRIQIQKKLYYMHRLIYLMHHGVEPEWIDHIDRDPSNNKIENLRSATRLENSRNKSPLKNKSGVTGVHWHKQAKKWQAGIRINGFYKSLGMFTDIKLAEIARKEAETLYFGEFAPNLPLKC